MAALCIEMPNRIFCLKDNKVLINSADLDQKQSGETAADQGLHCLTLLSKYL